VLNFWLIIPKFGEFGRLQQKTRDVQKLQLDKYKAEIANKPVYEAKIRELLKTGGSDVPTEEAALRIFDEVNAQAALTGVNLTSITPVNRSGGKTNAFFEEASVNVQYNCGEKELVDFLNKIADRSLLIRAKSIAVGPDPTRTRLQGKLTLVKSYQRKAPVKAAAPAAKPAAAAPAKPVPSTTAKPAPTPPATPAGTKAPKN
jgi:pyruvate/2-oxoglutarate dehydrogenase complex dihydrolipoamide acyltransferase (E2) component